MQLRVRDKSNNTQSPFEFSHDQHIQVKKKHYKSFCWCANSWFLSLFKKFFFKTNFHSDKIIHTVSKLESNSCSNLCCVLVFLRSVPNTVLLPCRTQMKKPFRFKHGSSTPFVTIRLDTAELGWARLLSTASLAMPYGSSTAWFQTAC